MIPQRYITEWRQSVGWLENFQVEQDLIISRALVAIYSDSFLHERLAFRGGTALNKLYAKPPARYSEDIDLVQIKPTPIGEVLTHLRKALAFIEGAKVTIDRGEAMTTMHYRFLSEDAPPLKMKLKVEMNCREHLFVFGQKLVEFEILNTWFSGNAELVTYEPEELLGTKLRALYQRRKGRDLFDLWYALTKLEIEPEKIAQAFHKYTEASKTKICRKDFLINLETKMKDTDFRKDIVGLLSPHIDYNIDVAYELVVSMLIPHISP